MDILTDQGKIVIDTVSKKYNLPPKSVQTLLQALKQSGGNMAQFNIPALGGSGQWMKGGMTMVGDMFNQQLKTTVNNLCTELSSLLQQQTLFKPSEETTNSWYPSTLGVPTATGSQNAMRYAYFQQAKRLVIDYNGAISIFDTLDHQISGIAQQQGGQDSVQFTSQYGLVDSYSLPLISGPSLSTTTSSKVINSPNEPETSKEQDIFKSIEKLGTLHGKGFLTDEEFHSKKTELLARL